MYTINYLLAMAMQGYVKKKQEKEAALCLVLMNSLLPHHFRKGGIVTEGMTVFNMQRIFSTTTKYVEYIMNQSVQGYTSVINLLLQLSRNNIKNPLISIKTLWPIYRKGVPKVLAIEHKVPKKEPKPPLSASAPVQRLLQTPAIRRFESVWQQTSIHHSSLYQKNKPQQSSPKQHESQKSTPTKKIKSML
jgi:hypothetical protein